MKYRLTVMGYDGGLNELIDGRVFSRSKKIYVNPVKNQYDKLCISAIRFAHSTTGSKKIKTPIIIHYKFYCKNKRHDRMNVASAFDKSFEDALQKCGKIKNDGWDDVLNVTYDFEVDKNRPRVEVVIEEVDSDRKMYEW